MYFDQEVETSQYLEQEETTPTISCRALINISTLQTLNIEGYIKRQRVTILIDSSSNHKFINHKLEKFLIAFYIQHQNFK